MKTITFEYETITPMFLAGADGKEPGPRPPSIKGLMRFWWRAMNGHLSIDKLKEEEAKIFGGSGEREGRSRFSIRIKIKAKVETGENIKDDYNIKWNYSGSENGLTGKDTGVGYLLYSTMLDNAKKTYIKDKQKFDLELKSNESDALKHAVASFWALAYLGGIGTRARRGAGNIAVTKIKDEYSLLKEMNLDFSLKGKDSNEVAEWLIKNYQIASSIVNRGEDTNFISEYSNLSISRFIISSTNFKDWKEALSDIGKQFASFCIGNKRDIFSTSAFGLPRKHITTNKPKEVNRRSSPLVFKVLKTDDKYYWMTLRFAGEFLPKDIVLKDNNKLQKPSYSKFDEFWNIIKNGNIAKTLSIPDTMKHLKDRIIKELSPSKIILFGSKARGDFHKDSDTDIAVVTDKSIGLSNINGLIDLVNFQNIDDKFRKAIDKEGIEI